MIDRIIELNVLKWAFKFYNKHRTEIEDPDVEHS